MVSVRIRSVTVMRVGQEHCVTSCDVTTDVMASTAIVTMELVTVRRAGMENIVLWVGFFLNSKDSKHMDKYIN